MQLPSLAPFRLGFDGGGTKTRAVVINAHAQVIGAGESGASNPYAVGMKGALDNLEIAADLALRQAHLGREDMMGWGMGLGGVCSPTESAAVEGAMRQRVGLGANIVAVEDVVAAWAGAFGGEAGSNEIDSDASGDWARAVCIAGTGANCWGKNAEGQTASADGAGPLLGDRGSGYWIGEQALRHATRVLDGVAKSDHLALATLSHFGVSDLKSLIRVVYGPDFERARIAGLVPTVLQHQEEETAREILSQAGRDLALTSLAVLRTLGFKANHHSQTLSERPEQNRSVQGQVALIGSILAHAEPVKIALLETLRLHAPHTQLVAARFEPAVGAALLA